MLEILTYSFFQKALLAGILVSSISGTLGSLVVLRREPNITHSIANMLFLGVVVSLFLSGNYYLYGTIFACIGVALLWTIERYTPIGRESSKEIIAQMSLASGIFFVGLLGNVQIDIFNFLFGNILFVQSIDIYLLIAMLAIGIVVWRIFGKRFVRTILAPEVAKSQGIQTKYYEFGYLLFLSLFIAFSLKMFGVLLLGAFLVLPGNIGKNFSSSFGGVFRIATIAAVLSVVIGLFASYYFDTSAGASIVLVLGIMFVGSIFVRRK